MRILIVEDEPLTQQRIQHILQRNRPEWKIIGSIQSIKEGKKLIEEGVEFDLLLCDIQLADGLSFKIFTELKSDMPVIFITAYDHYALHSFEHHCIDYVLKPIEEKRLIRAFEKMEKKMLVPAGSPALVQESIEEVFHKFLDKQYKKRFLTKVGSKFRFLPSEDIAYFYTEEGIVFLVEKQTGNRYSINHSLNELQLELLDPKVFFRINRTVIIHLNSLIEMRPYHNGRLALVMDNHQEMDLIVAREKVNEFKNWLNQ